MHTFQYSLYIFFLFFRSHTCPLKLAPGKIEPETLRGSLSKVPSQHHQTNPSGFSISISNYKILIIALYEIEIHSPRHAMSYCQCFLGNHAVQCYNKGKIKVKKYGYFTSGGFLSRPNMDLQVRRKAFSL